MLVFPSFSSDDIYIRRQFSIGPGEQILTPWWRFVLAGSVIKTKEIVVVKLRFYLLSLCLDGSPLIALLSDRVCVLSCNIDFTSSINLFKADVLKRWSFDWWLYHMCTFYLSFFLYKCVIRGQCFTFIIVAVTIPIPEIF